MTTSQPSGFGPEGVDSPTAELPLAGSGPDTPAGRHLVVGASALFASRLVVAGLGWAGTILIVRELSAEAWGQFSLVFTILALFSFVTSLGSSRIVLAELAKPGVDAGTYAGSYIVLRVLMGLLAYASSVLFCLIAGYPHEVVLATLAGGVVLVIGAVGNGLEVVFQSSFKLGPVAVANVLGQLGQLALTVLVATTRPTLLLFVIPAIAYDVIAAGYKAFRVRPLLVLRYRFNLREWWRILVQATPIAAGWACATIAISVDLILLSKVDTFSAVGTLAVADKFAVIVRFVPLALEPPLVALLASTWPRRPAAFFATVRRGTLLMSLSAGIVVVGFLPVAESVVTILYGEDYRDATLASQLSVLAAALMFYGAVVQGGLIAMGRNRDFLLLEVTGLAVKVLTSVAFVPTLSVLGAGIARVSTAAIMLVIYVGVAIWRMRAGVGDLGRHARIAGTALVAMAIGAGADQITWWPLAATVSLVFYLGVIELTKATGPGGLRGLLKDEEAPAEA